MFCFFSLAKSFRGRGRTPSSNDPGPLAALEIGHLICSIWPGTCERQRLRPQSRLLNWPLPFKARSGSRVLYTLSLRTSEPRLGSCARLGSCLAILLSWQNAPRPIPFSSEGDFPSLCWDLSDTVPSPNSAFAVPLVIP